MLESILKLLENYAYSSLRTTFQIVGYEFLFLVSAQHFFKLVLDKYVGWVWSFPNIFSALSLSWHWH